MKVHVSENGFRYTTMAYDPLCESLAIFFLDEKATQQKVAELAQAIQDAIEDFLESHD